MRLLLVLAFITLFFASSAQEADKPTQIVAEGKRLYRSEMASWYGTDIFLEKFKDQKENLGGYFSYDDNDSTRCLFFSKGDDARVLATITFDSTYRVSTAHIDGSQRNFSGNERDIYLIRKKALATINSDTLFKKPARTNLNLIPIISATEKKVYVLTGPEVDGVMIFGNDYLLSLDENNNIVEKRQLHKNIIPINYGTAGQEVVGTMHTHLADTGDLITPTDICTLMLYEKFAKWKQHIVMSARYVCIWDCQTNRLATLTREAWDNIGNSGKKK